mgnify:CR=1 FL=1
MDRPLATGTPSIKLPLNLRVKQFAVVRPPGADGLFLSIPALNTADPPPNRKATNGTSEAASVCREAQEKFLGEHLGVCIGRFRERLDGSGAGGFYALLAG